MRKISGSLLVALIFMLSALHAIAVPTYSKPVMTLGRGSMLCADFSPDDRWCATGSQDGQLTLWDNWDGSRVRDFVGHTIAVRDVRFSPDGNSLYSVGGDGVLMRWDVATGAQLATQTSPDPPISADINSSGTLLVVLHQSGLIQLCDPLTADPLSTVTVVKISVVMTVNTYYPLTIRFSKHFNHLLITDGVNSSAYTISGQGAVRPSFARHMYMVDDESSVVYDTYNELIWAKLDGTIIKRVAFAAASYQGIAGYIPETNEVLIQPLSVNNGVPDYSIQAYCLGTEKTRVLSGTKDNVIRSRFSKNGDLLQAAAADGRIWAWTNLNSQLARNFHIHDTVKGSIEFSKDSRKLLTSDEDSMIDEYEFPSGKLLVELSVFDWKPYIYWQYAHFLNDQSKIAACDVNGNIKIWNAESGELLTHKILPDLDLRDISCIPSTDSLLVHSVGPVKTLLYDWHTSQTKDLHSTMIRPGSHFISQDRILTASDIHYSPNGEPTLIKSMIYESSWPSLLTMRSITLPYSNNYSYSLGVSPDSMHAILGRYCGKLIFVDLKLFTVTKEIQIGSAADGLTPYWIKFLPDGNRFLVGHLPWDSSTIVPNKEIELRDADTGELLASFNPPGDLSQCGDVSPDGKYFAAAQFGRVYVYELPAPNGVTNWVLYQ